MNPDRLTPPGPRADEWERQARTYYRRLWQRRRITGVLAYLAAHPTAGVLRWAAAAVHEHRDGSGYSRRDLNRLLLATATGAGLNSSKARLYLTTCCAVARK